jgi:hypothetical protein
MGAIAKRIKSRIRDPHPRGHTFLPHLYPSKVGKEHSTYSSAETMPKTETEPAEVSSIDLELYTSPGQRKEQCEEGKQVSAQVIASA